MPTEDLVTENAPDTKIAALVRDAVAKLLDIDALLFILDANERSLTHRLALHLTPVFPDWDVDCEYNRTGLGTKVIQMPDGGDEPNDANGSRVYPDVVVHCRNEPNNLLVIEVKKSTSNRSDDADIQKLIQLRKQLNYAHALFIRFACGHNPPAVERVEWC